MAKMKIFTNQNTKFGKFQLMAQPGLIQRTPTKIDTFPVEIQFCHSSKNGVITYDIFHSLIKSNLKPDLLISENATTQVEVMLQCEMNFQIILYQYNYVLFQNTTLMTSQPTQQELDTIEQLKFYKEQLEYVTLAFNEEQMQKVAVNQKLVEIQLQLDTEKQNAVNKIAYITIQFENYMQVAEIDQKASKLQLTQLTEQRDQISEQYKSDKDLFSSKEIYNMLKEYPTQITTQIILLGQEIKDELKVKTIPSAVQLITVAATAIQAATAFPKTMFTAVPNICADLTGSDLTSCLAIPLNACAEPTLTKTQQKVCLSTLDISTASKPTVMGLFSFGILFTIFVYQLCVLLFAIISNCQKKGQKQDSKKTSVIITGVEQL
ncbi:Hypothetical_protein [Hexamita inflata]|uniref:Hypothetical_protein n=1 Tax=Hexamita inflata TaxID=28002 RepID=A0AA86P2U1_9EUKA|nr:Hypothetical protein HINF_LOCUS18178 [Hexamita inflata]CAI9930550.1 Hypothetical protein HINF_LOCUS18195 [Hexamita inflata]